MYPRNSLRRPAGQAAQKSLPVGGACCDACARGDACTGCAAADVPTRHPSGQVGGIATRLDFTSLLVGAVTGAIATYLLAKKR